MKNMTILLFISYFMLIPTIAEAQRRTLTIRTEPQDSGYLKSQIYKHEKMAHNGTVTMIIGGSVSLVGAAMFIGGLTMGDQDPDPNIESDADGLITAGYITAGVGVVTVITGAIIRGTGRGRAEEYRIRLDNMNTTFYINPQYIITPKYTGIALTLRF